MLRPYRDQSAPCSLSFRFSISIFFDSVRTRAKVDSFQKRENLTFRTSDIRRVLPLEQKIFVLTSDKNHQQVQKYKKSQRSLSNHLLIPGYRIIADTFLLPLDLANQIA